MIKFIFLSISLLFFYSFAYTNPVNHSHGKKAHSHPLPKAGVKHRHGNSEQGTLSKPESNEAGYTIEDCSKYIVANKMTEQYKECVSRNYNNKFVKKPKAIKALQDKQRKERFALSTKHSSSQKRMMDKNMKIKNRLLREKAYESYSALVDSNRREYNNLKIRQKNEMNIFLSKYSSNNNDTGSKSSKFDGGCDPKMSFSDYKGYMECLKTERYKRNQKSHGTKYADFQKALSELTSKQIKEYSALQSKHKRIKKEKIAKGSGCNSSSNSLECTINYVKSWNEPLILEKRKMNERHKREMKNLERQYGQ